MDSLLLLISAIGGAIAAGTGLLLYWSRHGLPNISATALEHTPKAHDSDLVTREVRFRQPTDTSKWLVYEVHISKPRHKWISVLGDPVWNDFGEFTGYHPGDWADRIRYDPPVADGSFLLHPDAPEHMKFSFRTCLRSRSRIKRKADVYVSTVRALS